MSLRSFQRAVSIILGFFALVGFWYFANEDYTGRWLFWSAEYKKQVLAKPLPPPGQLRYIEWDGWGFSGLETSNYLVFDPDDKLALVRPKTAGRFPEIPCSAAFIHPFEPHWYLVQYYTNSSWEVCEG